MPEGRAAAIAVLALGAYYQVVRLFDLFPWNDIRGVAVPEPLDVIVAGATLIAALLLWFGGKFGGGVVSLALIAVAVLQARIWWFPYFGGGDWRYVPVDSSRTISILPDTDYALAPDANQIVLHLLILGAIAFSLNAFFPRARGKF